MKLLESYFTLRKRELFAGILFINILIIWLSQTITFNETVFINSYSDHLTYHRTLDLLNSMKSVSWIAYLLYPVMLLLKITAIGFIIYTGVFFSDVQNEITLGKVITVVLASEIVLVAGAIAKLLWFVFVNGNYSLDDFRFFYPLSLINLFSRSEVAEYWVYPLQTVNLFHFLYILMLAAGLAKISSVSRMITDKIIVLTYIPAMVLWIVLIMFLTVDIS